MKRLQTYYEQMQFTLKALMFSSLLIALGSFLINPSIVSIFKLDNPTILMISEILLYSGGIILTYFPLYAFVKLLSHKKDEENIVVIGLISYIVFFVIVTILANPNLPDSAYFRVMDMTIKGNDLSIYRIGSIGFILVYFVVSYVFNSTKGSKKFNIVSYLDKDTMRLFYSVIGTIIVAVIFSIAWPHVIEFIFKFLSFVASDVNNPMSMFAYGGFERLMTLFNLENIIHQEIWFGTLGGSWVNLAGKTFSGDVNIWAAQLTESMNVIGTSDAGRFTSAYYVLNIFAMPAYLIGIYSVYTNKDFRNRNIMVLVLTLIVSIISGILLPLELMMLVTSPLIYLFHLFMSSFVYAILSGLSIYLGFSYNGFLLSANPGNIIDLITLSRKPVLFDKIVILLLVGIFTFLIYFVMTRLYYSKLALDLLNIGSKEDKINDFIERLGGIENIEKISNTPTRIHASLIDRDKLNVAGLHRQGVTKIVETRAGFILSIGSSSYIYQNEVNKRIKNNQVQDDVND